MNKRASLQRNQRRRQLQRKLKSSSRDRRYDFYQSTQVLPLSFKS